MASLKQAFQNHHLPCPSFWGSGGPALEALGFECTLHIKDLAFMGFTEVLPHYAQLSRAYRKLLQEIRLRQPQAVILIDYPGFNLRLARDAYELGLTTIYHIPPKSWAHGAWRNTWLRNYTDLITTILPFETNYFRAQHVPVQFVGNPLLDKAMDFQKVHAEITEHRWHVGLLPGSRAHEVTACLPIFLKTYRLLKQTFPQLTGEVSVYEALDPSLYEAVTQEKDLTLNSNIYEVIKKSRYCMVCSGTATLETAFFETPLSACYKVSAFTAWIAKKIIKVPYVSLVNLCAGKALIPEFLQEEFSPERLAEHAKSLLTQDSLHREVVAGIQQVKALFPLNAPQNLAEKVFACVQEYDVSLREKLKKRAQRKTLV